MSIEVQSGLQSGLESTEPETPNREDVWSHDTCLMCQTKHSTPEEKEQHEKEDIHKSRTVVYDFFSKELSSLLPSSSESILYERYYRANTSVAGLDCISELNFSWSTSPLWACTICYIAGKTLESADNHLYSSYHKRNYINEYHPDRFGELVRAQEKSTEDKFLKLEHDVILDFLYEAKGLSPPDVYILSDRSRSWAFEKLGLIEEETKPNYIVEPISDHHQIVACHICGECFLAYEKDELLQKAWNVHLSTNVHQRSTFMHSLLKEANVRDVEGLPTYCSSISPLVTDLSGFTKASGAFYGKSCGFEFLVAFKDIIHSFCSICFCVLSNSDVTNHFSSEYHIARCVKRTSPSKLFNSEYMSVDERQQILLDHLQKTKSANDQEIRHKTCDVTLPLLLKKFSFPDKRAFESITVKETMIGSFKAAWCEDCKQYINLEVQVWQQHILDDDHFENATKRVLCYIDNNHLVSRSAAKSLPPFKKSTSMMQYRDGTQQGWYNKHSSTLGPTLTQDNCYFGLQYVVRDELNRQTTCLCCYFVCTYEEDETMSLHVRTMDHISRAVHMINKELLGVLWKYRDLNMEKSLLWDYLTHCNLDSRNESVVVYDPVMACTANCFGFVPTKLIEIANAAPELRQSIAEVDNSRVPLNIAFRMCNVEVKAVENEYVVLYCQECCQGFASSFDKVSEKFAEHILSQSHFKRKTAFVENAFDENKRVAHIFSAFEVTAFQQLSDTKKVTWKWNETRNGFEFVYAQLGMSDIVERRNFQAIERDMFCRLCAESIKASQPDLEQHIRSFAHIFYYVHKYRPEAIHDLETHLLDAHADSFIRHRNIRRLFQRTLKGLEKEKGEVSIFDFSVNRFCKSAEVKDVLEKESEPMQIIDNKSQIQAAMAVYANKLELANTAEVQKFIQRVMKKSSVGFSGKEVTLDDAKHILLHEVDFSVSVDVGEKGRKDDTSSTPAASVQESMPQRPEAEPDSEVISRRSKSRSRSLSSRSNSKNRRRSRSPPGFMFDERTRAGRWSGSRTRTRRAKSALKTVSRRSESRSEERSPLPARPIPRRAKTVMKPRLDRQTERSRRSKSRSKERSPLPARPIQRRSKTVMKLRSDTQTETSPSSICRQFSDWLTFNSNLTRTSELTQNVNIPPSVPFGAARPIQRRSKTVMKPRDVRLGRSAFDHVQLSAANAVPIGPGRYQLPYTRVGISPENTPGPPGLMRNPYKSKDPNVTDQAHGYSLGHRSRRKSKSPSRKRSKIPSMKLHRSRSRTPTPVRYMKERLQKNSNERKRTRYHRRSKGKNKTDRSKRDDRKRFRKSRSRSRSRRARSRSPSQMSSTRHRDRSRDRSWRRSRSSSHSGSRSISGCDRNRSNSRSSDKVFAPSSPDLQQNLMNRLKGSTPNKIQINLSSNSIKALKKDEPQSYDIRNAPEPTKMVKEEGVIAEGPPTVPFGIPTNPLPPSTSNGFSAPAPIQKPIVVTAEVIMRAKMELYKKDLIEVQNVAVLKEYLWIQGYDELPPQDPLLFNEVVKNRRGTLGASTLYQIICYGHPELETYFCGTCRHWTTVSDMFVHLMTPIHRLNYMSRNYKVCHTKAVNEPDKVMRDVLLDKFANKIWDSEGSGQCNHRMRCILNQETIARLWPKYKDCIDNSWKIMVFDDDEPHNFDTRPVSRTPTGSSDSRSHHRSTSGLYGQPEDSTLKSAEENPVGFPSARSPNQSPEMDSLRCGQAEKSRSLRRGRFLPSEIFRRTIGDVFAERSRSKSRYSRSRVRSRSSSYEPDRKRRSRDEERQNEPSRSKSPAREFETKDPGKVDSWDENAASFLYKIGDREGALKLFVSSNREQESRLQAQESRNQLKESRIYDQENEPPSLAYESVGASDDDSLSTNKTPIQAKAGPSASIQDRLRSMVPRDSLGAQEKIRLLTELDKPEELAAARPEHTAQTASPQTTASRFAAKNAAQVQAMDDATKHRKVVGAMVQLRSMADAEGGMVSNDTFFAVCEEVGLPPDEVFVNQTLQQFIAYFTAIIDVRSAYQQYLAYKESQLAPPTLSVQSQPGQEPVLTTQQIRDILNKIDIGEQSQP